MDTLVTAPAPADLPTPPLLELFLAEQKAQAQLSTSTNKYTDTLLWQALVTIYLLLSYTLLFSLSEACGAGTFSLAQIWAEKAEIDIII